MARVLIVDDEKSIRRTLGEFLREAGYEVDGARIIQIGKGNNEEYQDHPIVETLDTYWQIFLRLLDVYWMKRGLDARKGGE